MSDRSTHYIPLGLQLRSTAPADQSRLGLVGHLSPPPAGEADVDHSSAVDSLALDWISSGLSWPSWNLSDMEEWAGFPLLDAILLLH